MTNLIQAAEQALKVMEDLASEPRGKRVLHPEAICITALRAAVEEAKKVEPVAWVSDCRMATFWREVSPGTKLYTHPQSAISDDRQTHNGKPMYYQRSPFIVGRHEYVDEDKLQAWHRVVHYEMCDGGNGRCKCTSRCIRAVCEIATPNVVGNVP